MANRYWITTSGSANFNDTANWSTTSGGSGGASVPTNVDVAIFDRTGTYTVNFASGVTSIAGLSHTAGNVTFVGVSGTILIMYGNFTLASTATWNLLGSLQSGGGGTINFTTNGVTLNCGINFGGITTIVLQSNVTLGSTYQFEVGSATLTMNDKKVTCGSFKCIYGGTVDWGTTVGASYFTLTGTGTIWNTTNMVTLPSGTFYSRVVYVQPSASGTYTIDTGAATENTALDWYFISMPSGSTIAFTNGNAVRVLQFDSASATCTVNNASLNISGGMRVNSANFAFASGSNAWTFLTGSGLQTNIKSQSSITFDFPFVINGARSWNIEGGVNLGSTRSLTHSAGDIILYSTLSVGSYVTAAGTKGLYLTSNTLVCSGSGNAFNNAAPTNFTFSGSTGKISLTSASAKTFVGAGGTYNCIVSNDGAGALTISGSNTFTTLANGVQPTAFTFTSGTTTTVTNWNISGTAGNLVTVGSTAASQHTLSKSSGTVNATYLNLSYSNATGGATWNATLSTNGGNNTGWIITSPNTGNFLAFFTQ